MLRGLGPAYIGGYGNEWIRTGTLDRLCTRGVTFDHHYATTTNATDAANLWLANHPDFTAALNHAGVATIRVRNHTTPSAANGWVFDETTERDADRPWSLLPIAWYHCSKVASTARARCRKEPVYWCLWAANRRLSFSGKRPSRHMSSRMAPETCTS